MEYCDMQVTKRLLYATNQMREHLVQYLCTILRKYWC